MRIISVAKFIIRVVVFCCILLFMAEILIRSYGGIDFPTYVADREIGYIPKPNQHGAFLQRNTWAFNDRSMGTGKPWNPAERRNILLIGNSVIMGGNHFKQDDKVGPLIQDAMGKRYAVWPIAANGWSNVNESVYLDRNPDVVGAAYFFVWEYMAGGLNAISQWRGEYIFPTHKPDFASLFVFRCFVLPLVFGLNKDELPPTGPMKKEDLEHFRAAVAAVSKSAKPKTRGLFFLYPKKDEYFQSIEGIEWLPERAELQKIADGYGIKIVDIAKAKEWNAALYRKDGIHPTVQGNIVLARILATAINENIGK